ncbi:MAG: iron ABC transporter permease [Anaerolineales bacterium]|nr:iron ABC transporter permease [Anaerolineales bacterium]
MNKISELPSDNRLEHPGRILLLMAVAALLVFVLSIFFGRYPAPGFIGFRRLIEDDLAQRLVFNLRLPRLITAVLLGMALAAGGTVFQMIFANPLVEPGFLGVSQGAAFGAALSIVFISNSSWSVQIFATIFSLLGLGISYFLSKRIRYGGWILRLVLAGIVTSAIFSSALGILKYMADPDSQLQEITFWMLGGLWSLTWDKLLSILLPVIIGLWIIYQMRWRLNLLSLQDRVAFSLGTHPQRERLALLVAAVAVTAAVISVSGIVSWVGLLVPHIARRIFGANTRYALPGSMLIGAIFVMLCDDLGRIALIGEIPLGIITSLFGAILFIILMALKNLGGQRDD